MKYLKELSEIILITLVCSLISYLLVALVASDLLWIWGCF